MPSILSLSLKFPQVNIQDLKHLSVEDWIDLYKDITKEGVLEILNLHADIRKIGIGGWTVDDTKKLIGHKIKTLKELKNQCATERGKSDVLERMKDIPKISELIDKLMNL